MSDLPQGWEWVTVGSIAESLVDGPFGSNLKTEHYQSSGVRVIRLQNIADERFDNRDKAFISPSHAEALSRHEARPGDLLMAAMGDVLPRVCILPSDIKTAIVKADCFRLRPRKSVSAKYLSYMLSAPQSRKLASTQIAGVGRPRLNLKKISALPIPLAPRAEQEQIVAAIEEQFSRLDAGVAALNRAQKNLELTRAAIIETAVSGHLIRTFDSAEVGELPAGWKMCSVEDIAAGRRNALAIGPFGSNLKVSDYTNTGVPLVFVRNVRSGAFGGTATRFISEEKAKELQAHRVEGGDVLVTKMGEPPGDAAVYPIGSPDAVVTADVIKISVREDVVPHYIALAISSRQIRHQIAAITSGVAQQKVSLARFRQSVHIPLPPTEEQVRITEEVARRMQEVDGLETTINQQLKRATALRSSILQTAFSGRFLTSNLETSRGEGRA